MKSILKFKQFENNTTSSGSTNSVFVLFETDSHKSNSSRVLLGVFSSFENAWNEFINDIIHGDRRLSKFEKCDMLGISDEDLLDNKDIDIIKYTNYDSASCHIIETPLDVLEEN